MSFVFMWNTWLFFIGRDDYFCGYMIWIGPFLFMFGAPRGVGE